MRFEQVTEAAHANLSRLRVPAGLFDRTFRKPMLLPRELFNLGLVHALEYGVASADLNDRSRRVSPVACIAAKVP